MEVVRGISSLLEPLERSVVTIGNFDGVHLGHQQLIGRVVDRARAESCPSVVVTFDPHPLQVLAPNRPFRRLFDFEDLVDRLGRLGVDYLVVEPFTQEFSRLSPETFFREKIMAQFNPVVVVVGYDFHFGAGGAGSVEAIRAVVADKGVAVEVVEPVQLGDDIISSSLVRQAVTGGDMALAAQLLGRPYHLPGHIECGDGRGRGVGYPTANLSVKAGLIPVRGVYCTRLIVNSQAHRAVTNIGVNPTFVGTTGERELRVETHVLDHESNLYGAEVVLEFYQRLRGEVKFSGVDELKRQIGKDVDSAQKFFRDLKLDDG